MKFCQSVIFTEPTDMIALAAAAERCGIDVIAVPDHLVVPDVMKSPYPYTSDGRRPWPDDAIWVDPWVAIAAMSAVTSTITFMTSVYIAPLRDVFSVAKAVWTASAISRGRVRLGVGVGWSAEEYRLVGRDFTTRGARLDEMVEALRLLWAGGAATYDGQHIHFERSTVAPTGPGVIPIYAGGGSRAARWRGVRLADGWIEGAPVDVEAASRLVSELRAELSTVGRDAADFEIIVPYAGETSLERYRLLQAVGVSGVYCPGFGNDPTRPLADRIQQMERFAADVIDRM